MPKIDPNELAGSIAKAHRKDQFRLLWLNVQEVVPCIVLAVAFALGAREVPRPAAAIAAALIVLAVGGFLLVTSIRHHLADRRWDVSMRDQVARRLAQVRHRAKLYRSILWWYLLPLLAAIALILYAVGELGEAIREPVSVGIIAVIFVGVYILNRWYGRTRFESEVERLEALLADFEEEETR